MPLLPEITVTELSEKLKSEDKFILLDVREPQELTLARVADHRLETTPMSRLAREGTKALSDAAQAQEATLYVMCHHGSRSAQVTAWLAQQGWENVFNAADQNQRENRSPNRHSSQPNPNRKTTSASSRNKYGDDSVMGLHRTVGMS